jgi:hypothetical protein
MASGLEKGGDVWELVLKMVDGLCAAKLRRNQG